MLRPHQQRIAASPRQPTDGASEVKCVYIIIIVTLDWTVGVMWPVQYSCSLLSFFHPWIAEKCGKVKQS